MKKIRVNKNLMHKWTKWPIGYGNIKVMVPYPENPREGICDACGRSVHKGEIKTTHLHHWFYAYRHSTVRKDPTLALENLSELCYRCHKVADSLRTLFTSFRKKDIWMLVKVALLMPDGEEGRYMKEKLDMFAKAWLVAREEDKKKTLNHWLQKT